MDSGKDTIEFKTFHKEICFIEKSLNGNISPILSQLMDEAVITHDAYDKVKALPTQLTSTQQATMIATSIRDRIELSSEYYHKLIEIMSDKSVVSSFKPAIKKLHGTFQGKNLIFSYLCYI